MSASLLLCSVVIIICILSHKVSQRIGVPALLLFLVVGMLFGSDGIFKIPFSNYEFAEQICSITLIFIIFYGGFGTNWKIAKPVASKAFLLSTIGVVITAGLTGLLCYYFLHFAFLESMLIGAIVSSTDAAAVFSILRSKKLDLKDGLASLLELESGSNDPFAYMLTFVLLNMMSQGGESLSIPYLLFSQIVYGLITGVVIALAVVFILQKVSSASDGLNTIFVVAVALLAYSLPTLVGGNGYLSVYIAGLILGNSKIQDKPVLVHFFDGVTGLMQILLFFLLGLLSFPSQIPHILFPSFMIALFLTLVGRPVAVTMILTPFRVPFRQQLFVSWAGLRGAASIVFAILATVSDASTNHDVFHIVFCICIFSVLLQGTLLPFMAKKLGLLGEEGSVMRTFNDYCDDSQMELIQIPMLEGHPWIDRQINSIRLPINSLVFLLKRGDKTLIPHGETTIRKGDVVILNCEKYPHTEEIGLCEVEITQNHPWCNHRINEIDLPKETLVVFIKKEGETVVPKGDVLIEQGDILALMDKNDPVSSGLANPKQKIES